MINLLLYGTLRLLLSVMSFPLTELVTETERKPSLVDDAYARAKGRHSPRSSAFGLSGIGAGDRRQAEHEPHAGS